MPYHGYLSQLVAAVAGLSQGAGAQRVATALGQRVSTRASRPRVEASCQCHRRGGGCNGRPILSGASDSSFARQARGTHTSVATSATARRPLLRQARRTQRGGPRSARKARPYNTSTATCPWRCFCGGCRWAAAAGRCGGLPHFGGHLPLLVVLRRLPLPGRLRWRGARRRRGVRATHVGTRRGPRHHQALEHHLD